MSALKRSHPGSALGRRVRPRRELSPEDELDSGSESPDTIHNSRKDAESEPGTSDAESDEDAGSQEDDESASDVSENDLGGASADASAISFGALAKAQVSLNAPGKSSKAKASEDEEFWKNNEALERKAGNKSRPDHSRSNKHAPTELSSKKAVSRKREVVPVVQRKARDPRFESLSGELDELRARKAYSFLDEYRESELAELKADLKKAKDDETKERLKRVILSMTSKMKAQARKDKEREILEKHRKEEKEKVKQGKQPFYLKKAEQKKRVLLDQFQGLKGKQLDHVIERRRKKLAAKEKKSMPMERRATE